MIWSKMRGIGSGEEAEKMWLFGYNGTGAALAVGTPVCWSVTSSDGRTLALPAAGNYRCFAGICEETVGTAAYTTRLLRYGPVHARVYGIATNLVPGVNLIMVSGQSYLHYGTEGELAGQPACFTALQTNATTDVCTNKVFVQF